MVNAKYRLVGVVVLTTISLLALGYYLLTVINYTPSTPYSTTSRTLTSIIDKPAAQKKPMGIIPNSLVQTLHERESKLFKVSPLAGLTLTRTVALYAICMVLVVILLVSFIIVVLEQRRLSSVLEETANVDQSTTDHQSKKTRKRASFRVAMVGLVFSFLIVIWAFWLSSLNSPVRNRPPFRHADAEGWVEYLRQLTEDNTPVDEGGLLASIASAVITYPELDVFDQELARVLEEKIKSIADSESKVYTACLFVRQLNGTQYGRYKHVHAALKKLLREASQSSLYACFMAYWYVEDEYMVKEEWRDTMVRQRRLVDIIMGLIADGRLKGGDDRLLMKAAIIEEIKLVDDPKLTAPHLPPTYLPTNLRTPITGVIPESTYVFKSAAKPVKLAFRSLYDYEKDTQAVIIKSGELGESDWMVSAVIKLMEEIWGRDGGDFAIRRYSVFPVKQYNAVWLEFVPSRTFQSIVDEDVNLYDDFKRDDAKMKRFVKSCAAYSVITYVLGIGDRHLDNLMLTDDGTFFHIDFDIKFMFGRDPKPMPPPLKISWEMVEGMGGLESEAYREFKCYTLKALMGLRTHAGLLLDFLSLHRSMIGQVELDFVRDRLALDKDDDTAWYILLNLLDESPHAIIPRMLDWIHSLAQFMRH